MSVELLTAAALAIVAAKATTAWELAALGWLTIVAVPLAFIDVAVRRLPNQLTAAAYAGTLALLGAAALAGHHPGQLGRAALAGAVLCGAYLVMLALFPGGIGGGDIKLAAAVGTALGWLGWPLLVTGSVACFAACTICSAFLLASRRMKFTDHVTLAPFILLGALVAVAV
jgi:leader peptidase (prepilin peptidase) / N-methyltransferase